MKKKNGVCKKQKSRILWETITKHVTIVSFVHPPTIRHAIFSRVRHGPSTSTESYNTEMLLTQKERVRFKSRACACFEMTPCSSRTAFRRFKSSKSGIPVTYIDWRRVLPGSGTILHLRIECVPEDIARLQVCYKEVCKHEYPAEFVSRYDDKLDRSHIHARLVYAYNTTQGSVQTYTEVHSGPPTFRRVYVVVFMAWGTVFTIESPCVGYFK